MPLAFEQRMRPTTRRTLEASMRHRPPVTRDARPRQLPTVTSHAVPTGEYQSDPPSLPEAIRCSNARAPTAQAAPLDSLLHIRGLMWNWRACGDGPDQAAEFERPQFVLATVAALATRVRMKWVRIRCRLSTPSAYGAFEPVTSMAPESPRYAGLLP